MNKIALFIIAALLATSAIAPVAESTGCILSDKATLAEANVCLICPFGKKSAKSGTATCADMTGDCVVESLVDLNGMMVCELCSTGTKFASIDNKCAAPKASPTSQVATCGLYLLDVSTALADWKCFGCAATVATSSSWTLASGCATAVTVAITATATPTTDNVAVIPGTISAGCTSGVDSTTTTANPCTLAIYSAASHIISYRTGSSAPYVKNYQYSANKPVTADGLAINPDVTDTKCWVFSAATTTTGVCRKCRPNTMSTFVRDATAITQLNVICSDWPAAATDASGAGSGKVCISKVTLANGTVACYACADKNKLWSAAPVANGSCDWTAAGAGAGAGAGGANNSSILGFSVAAFLLLIINRLF